MRIEITTDKNYPIYLNDSYGGYTYLHRTIVEDDVGWKMFIEKLEAARKQVLANK